jgi:GTPase
LRAALPGETAPAPADEDDAEEPADDSARPIRVAVVGRPNAGKSTLVNRLLGEERLLTGPEAGITRDTIAVGLTWHGRDFLMHDTAGLRRPARIEEKLEQLSVSDALEAIRFAEVVVLLMDAAATFEDQDLRIADLVEREGRALVIGINKWDLKQREAGAIGKMRAEAERRLQQLKGVPVVAVSGLTGEGLDRLMQAVIDIHGVWNKRVSTNALNRWLEAAVEAHPPPAVSGRRLKLNYMTQPKTRPPTFVVFCTRADAVPEAYLRYLSNGLRESFELPGVPIRITVKSNKNPYAEGEEKSGQGSARAPFGEVLPKTGLKAKTRIAANAKAKAGAAGKPKLFGKSKPQGPKAKAGSPRGRAAKLLRPGTKPKRASRPPSSGRRPR